MNNYPIIHPELTWRLLDSEAVIVSPTSGDIRVLNQTGTEIWQLLADGCELEKIEMVLVDQYNLSLHQAKVDVSVFLEDLMRCGLIILKSHEQ
jgi:hypothetical protein